MLDLQTESIHFKARILDLYEVYAKKQPTNPLVIELVIPLLTITKNSGNAAAALSNKASSLIRKVFGKPKDLPVITDATAAQEVLTSIHDMARKTYSGEFTLLCSIGSIFVARAMDSSSTGSKQVVEVYQKTMEEYMTHKATMLHATFLSDYFKRHPLRAWPLHSALVPFLYPGKPVNIYRQNIAYELLSHLAPRLPEIHQTQPKQVDSMIPKVIDAFYATLAEAQNDDAWKSDKVKDFLKPVLAFARATKSVGYEWDMEKLDQAREGVKSGRLANLGSVTSLLNQLRAVASKDPKAKTNENNGKANGKGSKKRAANCDGDGGEAEQGDKKESVPQKKRKATKETKETKEVKVSKVSKEVKDGAKSDKPKSKKTKSEQSTKSNPPKV